MFDGEVGVIQPHGKESTLKMLLLSALDARAVRDAAVALRAEARFLFFFFTAVLAAQLVQQTDAQ